MYSKDSVFIYLILSTIHQCDVVIVPLFIFVAGVFLKVFLSPFAVIIIAS